MLHIRLSHIAADPPALDECVAYRAQIRVIGGCVNARLCMMCGRLRSRSPGRGG